MRGCYWGWGRLAWTLIPMGQGNRENWIWRNHLGFVWLWAVSMTDKRVKTVLVFWHHRSLPDLVSKPKLPASVIREMLRNHLIFFKENKEVGIPWSPESGTEIQTLYLQISISTVLSPVTCWHAINPTWGCPSLFNPPGLTLHSIIMPEWWLSVAGTLLQSCFEW